MARLRARQSYALLSSLLVSAVIFLSLALWGRADCVSAQPAAQALYLDVSINGRRVNKVASFLRHGDGRFSATRAELRELAIEVGDAGKADDRLFLDSIDSLRFTYDEPQQKIAIEVQASALQRNTYSASGRGDDVRDRASVTTGAVLNYGLYGSVNEEALSDWDFYEGASVALEGRIYGDFGTIEATTISGFTDFDTRRIDTSWSYSFTDSLITLRAGDFVSGGYSWTRPVRMAGFKIERNFDLRPDLITKPLPTISGSAAVPSTVDVYVNNIKTYSKEVPGGPFTVRDLPVISGSGVTRVVVRDPSGRETISETPFYSSSSLLRESIWDFSVEAGLARLNYGTRSFDYDFQPIASASVRYGVSDNLTLAWHGEAGLGVINGGAAFVTRVGLIGTVEFGLSASRHDGSMGGQVFASFEGDFGGITLNARTQRAFNGYTDVAAHALDSGYAASTGAYLSVAPATAIDFVSLGVPIEYTGGNLNVSYVHTERADGETFDIGSVSYSQSLTDSLSLYSTAFKSFSDAEGVGFYLGLTMALDDGRSVSSGVGHDSDGTGVTGTYAKTAGFEPGSLGWRVHVSDGRHEVVRADVDYTASKALLRGSLAQGAGGISGSYAIDGAVAVTQDGVFLSRPIDDAFAVVDAGAPGVEVRVENQMIGTTDASGKLLVTGLHAYQKNKIAIEPNSLPVNARIPTTKIDAVPADRSGMSVRFDVDTAPKAALVEFRTADGSLIEAGHKGILLRTGEEFVIGYDGQAYIEGLSTNNTVEIAHGGRECRATFAFAPDSSTQVLIGGVTCS
ncbi:MAG: fimbria/pilus outer membrane usher protein [Hyphomicrobiaceae bacterium]